MKKNKINPYYILISIILMLYLITSISTCTKLQKITRITDENIFDKNINKVVEIRVSNDNSTWGYGTGCFISSDGNILTNKHMVYNQTTNDYYEIIQIRLPSKTEYEIANVVKISETDDIAIINIKKTNLPYFKISNNYHNGEEIYTIGNPNGFGLSFTKGNISSKLRYVTYNNENIEAIQTSLVVNEGNSGGPVFNKNGQLIGIISFRLKDKKGDVIQGVSFAIPSYKIENFVV